MATHRQSEKTLQAMKSAWFTEKERNLILLAAETFGPPLHYCQAFSLPQHLRDNTTQGPLRDILFGPRDILDQNPVLIARQMLQATLYILRLPAFMERQLFQDQHIAQVVKRAFDTVRQCVTGLKVCSFSGTVELIQCHILERMLLEHMGRFEPALEASRRALDVADEISLNIKRSEEDVILPKQDASTTYEEQWMWAQMVEQHAVLCLLVDNERELDGTVMKPPSINPEDLGTRHAHFLKDAVFQILRGGRACRLLSYEEAVALQIRRDEIYLRFPSHRRTIPHPGWLMKNGYEGTTEAQIRSWMMGQCEEMMVTIQLFLPFLLMKPVEQPGGSVEKRIHASAQCSEAARGIIARFLISEMRDAQIASHSCKLRLMSYMSAIVLLLVHAECNILPGLREHAALADEHESDFMFIRSVASIEEQMQDRECFSECASFLEHLKRLLELDSPPLNDRTKIRRIDKRSKDVHQPSIEINIPRIGSVHMIREPY